jgi:hypothetical protein
MQYTIKLGTLAISDHVSRLYDEFQPRPDGTLVHVDGEASGMIKVITEGKKISLVEMTAEAVKEFLSDMEYQIEVAEGEWDRPYRTQCQRAYASVCKQTTN